MYIEGKLILVWLKSNLRTWDPSDRIRLAYLRQTSMLNPSFVAGGTIGLRSYCTSSWECSQRRAWKVSWVRRLSYFMILLFLHPDPWFVTSLLAFSIYFFFVLLFLEAFLLWIFSPDSCYLPSKIFCNQINIESKLNKEITKTSLYFIQYIQRIR